MELKLDCTKKHIKYKLVSGNSKEKDLLSKIPGKAPVYDKQGVFQYWEAPLSSLGYILAKFTPEDLNCSSEVSKEVAKRSSLDLLNKDKLEVFPADGKTLKKHQEDYITISKEKESLLLSFDTGLGKTLSALLRAKQQGFTRLLIVCPKKLRHNWITEIEESLGQHAFKFVYWGTRNNLKSVRENVVSGTDPRPVCIVSTYESCKNIWDWFHYDALIIDEVHILGNHKTNLYKQVEQVRKHLIGNKVQALSATPMRLKIGSLWAVLNLVDSSFAGSYSSFVRQYEKVERTLEIEKNGRVFKVPIKVSTKNEDELRERLKSIMYRVKKSDVVDFKDDLEIVDCELTKNQKDKYNEAVEDLLIKFEDKELKVNNKLTMMLRLQQISEGLFNLNDSLKDSGKLEFLKDELKDLGDQKVVIWSRFEPITREIYNMFPGETVVYSGNQTEAEKQLAVWAFQGVTNETDRRQYEALSVSKSGSNLRCLYRGDPGSARVFAGTHSLRSGMGINLHKASVCLFTSFDWSPVAVFQARDRVSRLGQTVDTITKFITSRDTIDRKALRLIIGNYNNQLALLDGRGSLDYKLTQDLIGLLRT